MITYRSEARPERTANHAEDGTFTVFEGLKIIAQLHAEPGLSVSEAVDLINADHSPKTAARVYPRWFQNLLDQGLKMDSRRFERRAYSGYLNYGVSMTDGHFAPEPFETWVLTFRKNPVQDLYSSNDHRHELAPYALRYASRPTPLRNGDLKRSLAKTLSL